MDIKDYSYILAIAEERSVTRAASKLYISQPSLSMFLSNLEKRLGYSLFVRIRGEMQLTEPGRVYVEYARRITNLDRSLDQELRNIAQGTGGCVKLGVTANRATNLLTRLLPVFRQTCPGVKLEIHEDISKQLEEKVLNHTLDLAILNEPNHPVDLCYTQLGREEIVVALPKEHARLFQSHSHPDSVYPWIDLKQMAQEPFILMKDGQRMRQAGEFLLATAEIQPEIALETRNIMNAYKLCSAGMGAFFVTDSFFKGISDDHITFFSCGNPPLVLPVVAAYLDEALLSPAAKKVIELLRDTAILDSRQQ